MNLAVSTRKMLRYGSATEFMVGWKRQNMSVVNTVVRSSAPMGYELWISAP